MNEQKKDSRSTNITGENIVNSIYARDHATVDVTQSSIHKTGDANLESLFALIEKQIKARPEDPDVDKQEIRAQVDQIKAEAAQGEQANRTKLERWIRNLLGMAPDIVDVMAASLGGPISGLTAVIQKIAAKVKAESENTG